MAREIHWQTLDAEGRERLGRLLAEKPILSEGGTASPRFWWWVLALVGIGLLSAAWFGRLGVIDGDYGRMGVLALPTWALGAMLVVRGAIGALAAPPATPWPPVLALYPWGVIDARTTRIRVYP